MTGRFGRLVVGLDGSPDAMAAAEVAAALAAELGAEVVGVHALGLLETWQAGPDPEDEHAHDGAAAGGRTRVGAARERSRRLAEEEWGRPLATAGVAHRVEVRDGNPVHVLLRAAAD